FNNSDFITFKQIGIIATSTTYGRSIEFINGVSNISILNNIISSPSTTNTLDTRALIYASFGVGKNNIIRNNVMVNGSHGMYTSTVETGMIFSKNLLINQFYMGIWALNKSSVKILGNVMQTNSTHTAYFGIDLHNCDSAINVSGNKISSASVDGYGILLLNCDGTSIQPGLISNNFVQLGTSGNGYGIYVSSNNNNINIYHNSINITSNSTTLARPFLSQSTGANISVQNNIFSNSGGGQSIYITTAAVISTMNYNDHFTTGPVLGHNAGTNYANLADWQLGTSRDLNSISLDPMYTSTPDLHLTVNSPDTLKSGITLSPIVPTDIDLTSRAVIPWMGAHESVLSPCIPMTLTSSATDNLCAGDTLGSITVSVTGGTIPFTYLWDDSNSQSTSSAINLASGIYQLVVTDAFGCTDSLTDTISILTTLSVQVTDSTMLTCFGSNDGSAIVAIAGGTSPYTISWIPSGSTNDTATGLVSGMHTVTVSDNNGCTETDSVMLTEPPFLSVSIVDSVDISCNGLSDGFAVASGSGGVGTLTYEWIPSGISNDTATGLPAGSHQVKVSDINACSNSDTVVIIEPAILAPDAGISADICEGESIVLGGTPTATGGVGPYFYSWSPIGSLDSSTVANPLASPTTSTTYLLALTDNNGCVSSDAVGINVNPTFLTIVSVTICDDDSVLLGGVYQTTTGTYIDTLSTVNLCDSIISTDLTVYPSYQFFNTLAICSGDSIQIGSVFHSTAGTYVDSFLTGNNCDSIISTTLLLDPAYNLIDSVTICSGDSFFLGGAYQFVSDTYIDTFPTISSCDSIIQTFLAINPPLVSSISASDASCFGVCDGSAIVQVTGGSGPFTYLWDDPGTQTNISATALCSGMVRVLITDAIGCSIGDSIMVNEPIEIALTFATIDVACFGNCDGTISVTAINGQGPYTYSWNNGAPPVSNPGNLCPNIYKVQVSDSLGCSTTDSAQVTEPLLITNSMTLTDESCPGICDGSASATVLGGVQPYTYSWSNAQTSSSISALCADTFFLVIQDLNGCSITDTVVISTPPFSNPFFTYADSVYCLNESNPSPDSITTDTGLFTAPSNVAIDSVTGLIDLSASIAGGPYTVTHTTGGSCAFTHSFNISLLNVPSVSIVNPGSFCGDDSTTTDLTGSPLGGIWSGGGIIDSINGTFSPLTAGIGIDTVIYTRSNSNCSNSDTAYVLVKPIPSVSMTGSTTICSGDSASFELNFIGPGPFDITYSDGTNTFTQFGINPGDSITLSPSITTTYTLESILDSVGCSGNAGGTITINVISNPVAPLVVPYISYCEGDAVQAIIATPQSGGSISWFEDTLSSSIASGNSFTPTLMIGSNIYYLIETINGCLSFAAITEVVLYGQNAISAGVDKMICIGEEVQLQASGGLSYQWYPSAGLSDTSIANPIASPNTSTTYYVRASVNDTCFYIDSVRVIIDDSPDCGWYIYNAFSPNNDGDNDLWVITGIDKFSDNKVLLFNRWEDKIREFDGYNNKSVVWDGTNEKGNELPDGTYFYIITVGEQNYNGWVQITR
ncbi:MAG: hypothetical protein COB85_06100, partial [Bacteroidetes bacterium]